MRSMRLPAPSSSMAAGLRASIARAVDPVTRSRADSPRQALLGSSELQRSSPALTTLFSSTGCAVESHGAGSFNTGAAVTPPAGVERDAAAPRALVDAVAWLDKRQRRHKRRPIGKHDAKGISNAARAIKVLHTMAGVMWQPSKQEVISPQMGRRRDATSNPNGSAPAITRPMEARDSSSQAQ
eukprot:scaffold433_cov257-Pinguiococcus_pyrenoidosus.AAC.34